MRDEPRRVVGVTEDVIHGVFFEREVQPAIYLSIAQVAPPAVAITLAVVTSLASWMPARRAAGVEPLLALRGE